MTEEKRRMLVAHVVSALMLCVAGLFLRAHTFPLVVVWGVWVGGLFDKYAMMAGVSASSALALFLVLGLIRDRGEQEKAAVTGKERTQIIRGYLPPPMEGQSPQMVSFDTFNPFATEYRRLSRSVTTSDMADFSYTFAIKISGDAADNDFRNKTIFLRGDENRRTVYEKEDKHDVHTSVCPRLYFENRRTLKVTVNTMDRINEDKTLVGDINSLSPGQLSARSLIHAPEGWVAIVVVFHKIRGAPGTSIKAYINGHIKGEVILPATLKLNQGPLQVLSDPAFTIANLWYYNYALSEKEVEGLQLFTKINIKSLGERYSASEERPGGPRLVNLDANHMSGHRTNY